MIVPQTLFKYVHPARVDVIERNLIRYTQPSALNDPFEGRVLAGGLASREYVLKEATPEFMDEQLREAVKRLPMPLRHLLNEKVLSAVKQDALAELPRVLDSLSPTIATAVTEAVSSKVRTLLGVLSLTADPRNPLMWSHYTDNGRGFVIGFDTTHPHFNAKRSPEDEFQHLRQVEYRNHRVARYLVDFTGIDLLYVKPMDWNYEKEWRIVRPLQDAHEARESEGCSIFLFSLPEAAISYVICGYDMREGDCRHLESALAEPRYSHVKVSRAALSSSEFGVEVSI